MHCALADTTGRFCEVGLSWRKISTLRDLAAGCQTAG
jgi:hypothetical protein